MLGAFNARVNSRCSKVGRIGMRTSSEKERAAHLSAKQLAEIVAALEEVRQDEYLARRDAGTEYKPCDSECCLAAGNPAVFLLHSGRKKTQEKALLAA